MILWEEMEINIFFLINTVNSKFSRASNGIWWIVYFILKDQKGVLHVSKQIVRY